MFFTQVAHSLNYGLTKDAVRVHIFAHNIFLSHVHAVGHASVFGPVRVMEHASADGCGLQVLNDAETKLKEMMVGAVSKSVANAEAAKARNVTGVLVPACLYRIFL